jgi:hypothetical protein
MASRRRLMAPGSRSRPAHNRDCTHTLHLALQILHSLFKQRALVLDPVTRGPAGGSYRQVAAKHAKLAAYKEVILVYRSVRTVQGRVLPPCLYIVKFQNATVVFRKEMYGQSKDGGSASNAFLLPLATKLFKLSDTEYSIEKL